MLLAALVLAGLDYRARDPDSILYAEISARLAQQPLSHWIAPEWPPRWYMSGPFAEHPAGFFLPAAALARLGYPARQAAYLVNALYQVLTIVLIRRVAGVFVGRDEARPLGVLIQLLPIAFTYRIRANHEPAVIALLLAALLGTERARGRLGWSCLSAMALVGLALVKGLFVLPALLACGLWLLARGRSDLPPERSPLVGWLGLALATAAVLGSGVAYEALYQHATGGSFLAVYLGRQLGAAAVDQSGAFALEKLYNLVWYTGRLLWFPFPWSLVAAASVVSAVRRGRSAQARSTERGAARRARGFVFALATAAAYLLLFSMSDRRADRYIFPAYYAIGSAGALAALQRWPRLRDRLLSWDRRSPLLAVVVWLALFGLHIAAGLLRIPTLKLWPPDA